MTRRISNITFFTAVSIAVLFSVVLLWNMDTIFDKFSIKHKERLRSFYIEQQKELIKNEVERLVKRVHAMQETAVENAKVTLQDQVRSADEFIQSVYINHDTTHHKEHIEAMINSFNWSHDSGYFYIISRDGKVLHHGGMPELIGVNLFDMADQYPRLVEFLRQSVIKGDNFGEYDYFKPGEGGTLFSKIGYAKFNKALGIIIGTGIYTEDLSKSLKNEILKTLKFDRFGYQNYGYFWIFDTDFNAIFHISSSMYRLDLRNFQDVRGKYVFREFLNIAKESGHGFSTYYWNIPGQDTPSEKISYLTYLPEWNWIVGAGFYFENFLELVKTEEMISGKLLKEEMFKNMLIIFSLLTITIALSLVIFKRIRNIEDEQEVYVNDLLQYKTLIDMSSIVSITDLRGVMLHVNDQMCEVTGYKKEELIGFRHNKLSHPDNPLSVYQELWNTISRGNIWRGIIKNLTKSGGYYFQKSTIVPFKDTNGKIIRYISISYDVTEVFENKTQLQKYLNSDPLTDLNNRNSLLVEIKNSKSADLAIIDIDDFHRINETYGMKTGDEILKTFACRLSENINLHRYYIYRLHSDVFAVFSTLSDKNLFIINVENAVREITKTSFAIHDKEIIVSTITGYAHGSDNILAHADSALQFAKANNISHYVYDPLELDNGKIYEQNARVVKMLNSAVEDDRVVPFFQPIVGADHEKYECLMRIIDTDGSIISPAEFLDISKQTRFYPQLTKIVAKKSIETFADTNACFSINVSAEDILNSETMSYIYDTAVEYNVMHRLILEIVESESLSSYSAATAVLNKFKIAGAQIAIDDFGTGYSNFDYLLKIKADYIKIDGSIIKLITKDERAVDIVQSIVSYSKKLKMKTIAEFISDEALSKKAKELGIDYQQGYFHGKPEAVPAKDVF